MASIFLDSQELIMIDYLEQGRTLNGAYYAGELRWLQQDIARKRWGKLTCGVLLLQDNAPTHTSQVAMTAATNEVMKSSLIFSWYGSFRLLYVLKTEILSFRFTV